MFFTTYVFHDNSSNIMRKKGDWTLLPNISLALPPAQGDSNLLLYLDIILSLQYKIL
jgi:hypothetical protein